ncbi:hypothetical protein L596_004610 [Steinernema carpocapsae]|uniref:Uncharacterized protein n=1 Tax=Steinernema carpocapsae TaxID=34508 RepID=A0A4U8UWG3_STECR|nr:hypothetical protein L596_004610 [Steinernema carpocapsae]
MEGEVKEEEEEDDDDDDDEGEDAIIMRRFFLRSSGRGGDRASDDRSGNEWRRKGIIAGIGVTRGARKGKSNYGKHEANSPADNQSGQLIVTFIRIGNLVGDSRDDSKVPSRALPQLSFLSLQRGQKPQSLFSSAKTVTTKDPKV